MIVFLQERGDRKRVAVVCANDASTRYAVEKGKEMGFIEPIYVDGDDKDECARSCCSSPMLPSFLYPRLHSAANRFDT